jgi:hypothetical protein
MLRMQIPSAAGSDFTDANQRAADTAGSRALLPQRQPQLTRPYAMDRRAMLYMSAAPAVLHVPHVYVLYSRMHFNAQHAVATSGRPKLIAPEHAFVAN